MFGKKKKLFQQDIQPRCAYCAKGAPLEEGRILCGKRGVVSSTFACPAFRYDPLKRVPPKPAKLSTNKLNEDAFRLD